MRTRALLPLLLCACGRIEFDPQQRDAAVAVGDGADAADSGLLLHFGFEAGGFLVDGAGTQDATCTTCPVATTRPGGGGAAAFDGATTCLRIAAPTLQPPRFTYSAWFNFTVVQLQTVFSKPLNSDVTFENSFELYSQTTANFNTAAATDSVPVDVPINEWHVVTGVYDGAQVIGYLDGVEQARKPTTVVQFAGDDFRIGCEHDIGTELAFFSGSIDDVRFYDRVLTPAEIAALAQ